MKNEIRFTRLRRTDRRDNGNFNDHQQLAQWVPYKSGQRQGDYHWFGCNGNRKIEVQIQVMSRIIDIDNFPSLSSVLRELERQEETKLFTTTKAVRPTGDHQARKPRSFTTLAPTTGSKQEKRDRRGSDPTGVKPKVNQPRLRVRSAPCTSIDRATVESDSRLTENAKKLSNEELALLYEDILKPLDFNSILFERMRLFEQGERV